MTDKAVTAGIVIRRLAVVRLVFFIFIGVLLVRLYNLQVMQGRMFEALASNQYDLLRELLPERGEILVNDPLSNSLFPVATNLTLSQVYAVPKDIKDPAKVAAVLAPILDVDLVWLESKLDKPNDPYEPIKGGLSPELAKQVSELNLTGIYLVPEIVRYYLGDDDYGQITGFIGFVEDKRQGQYGVEQYWDKILAGQQGELKAQREVGGSIIALGQRQITKAVDGADIILTIDKNIQTRACAVIKKAVEKHGAKSGSVVILEPSTGAILAMCGVPNFNPNEYSKVADLKYFSNEVVSGTYEPGSVFKPITMSAALESGAVRPETTYFDTGEVRIGPHIIRNSDKKANGVQNMTQVLEQSLNTGAIFAMRQAGVQKFREVVEKFGFGKLTGIELPNEKPGSIKAIKERNEIYPATASFGQGITVTPLQLAVAFGAIANGGRLMKPYIVQEVRYSDDRRQVTIPTMVTQVISPETATTLGAMMVQVIEHGHGKRAGVPGYYIAGKTGTAQVPYLDRPGYDPNRTIGSFVGFAPVEAPKFVMVVRVDEPQGLVFAESSAAPVFGEMAKFLLEYYQVPPQRIDD